MILTSQKVLSHRDSNWKLDELGKQERREREEFAGKNERLGNALKASEKTVARHKKVAGGG